MIQQVAVTPPETTRVTGFTSQQWSKPEVRLPWEAWQKTRSVRNAKHDKSTLLFAPHAWAKLLFFRDRGPTEIGGFGVTSADDLLYIEDFVTVKQTAWVATVSFDDDAVADHFDNQVDAKRKPEQFARIWLHTHPGDSATPSYVDEGTFKRVFGGCEWAIMFVLGKGGSTTSRIKFNVGPGYSTELGVAVDFTRPFSGSDWAAWEAEYQANIVQEVYRMDHAVATRERENVGTGYPTGMFPENLMQDLEEMDPAERQAVLQDLAGDEDLYDPWAVSPVEEATELIYE